jgi:ferredoxin
MCLFICPTGATDTENGQIDQEKCIDGCRLCVDACPSHAIYLVPERYPERKLPDEKLADVLTDLLMNKSEQWIQSLKASVDCDAPVKAHLLKSLALSSRILAEDCIRESGYMVPDQVQFRALMESGLIQKLYTAQFKRGDSKAIEELMSRILHSLHNNRDAEGMDISSCGDCVNR